MSDTPGPSIKTLRFPPDHMLAISYDLVRDWQGVFENQKQFRAVLQPTFFEFTAQNGLVHPKLDPIDIVNSHFDWQMLPLGWTIETSLALMTVVNPLPVTGIKSRMHCLPEAIFDFIGLG